MLPSLASLVCHTEGKAEKEKEERDAPYVRPSGSRRKGTPKKINPVTPGKTPEPPAPEPPEKTPEEKMLASRTWETYSSTDLYGDLQKQSGMCNQVSLEVRQSPESRMSKRLVTDQESGDLVPPASISDIDVAISYDIWKGLELDDPQAERRSHENTSLTMYFVVHADEAIDVEEIEQARKGVRIDRGRLRDYKDFKAKGRKENKSIKEIHREWEKEEKDRRVKEAARIVEGSRKALEKKLNLELKLEKAVYLKTFVGLDSEESWEEELERRKGEFEPTTAYKARKARRIKEAGLSGASSEDQEKKIGEELEGYKYPEDVDEMSVDSFLERSENLLKATSSLVETFNEGPAPFFDSSFESREKYREFLRKNLYRFGLGDDFFYKDKDSSPYPSNGVVILKWNALLAQDRRLGRNIYEFGTFLKRCDTGATSGISRNEKTNRPSTYAECNQQTCPNWKKYIRASRYKMEVARLWYKLYRNQEPEVISRMESEAGITVSDKPIVSRPIVLSVIEYGNRGVLKIPKILPQHTVSVDTEGRDSYKIKDPEGFTKNLKPEIAGFEEVEARGDYTWPLQKIGTTPEWIQYSKEIALNNGVSLGILDAVFKDDLTNSFDWYDGNMPQKLKDVLIDPEEMVGSAEEEESREGNAWYLVEQVFDGIVKAIPVWAMAYLSTDLVNDEWVESEDTIVSYDAMELGYVKAKVEEENDNYEVAKQTLETAKGADEPPLVIMQLNNMKDTHHFEMWKHIAKLTEITRNRRSASFIWHAYPTDTDFSRSKLDGDQDPGTLTTWSKTQLHRCVSEVDTRPVLGEGYAPPPPDHIPFHYFIGPDKSVGGGYGVRGLDRKTLIPGSENAHNFYTNWFIEKYKGRGVGNVNQLVTLQDMFGYAKDATNPQYVQTQGQWGYVKNVDENLDGSKTFKIHVLSYSFSNYTNQHEADGKCDEEGRPFVTVDEKHVWPLSYDDPIRYGDIVAQKTIEYELKRAFAFPEDYDLDAEELRKWLQNEVLDGKMADIKEYNEVIGGKGYRMVDVEVVTKSKTGMTNFKDTVTLKRMTRDHFKRNDMKIGKLQESNNSRYADKNKKKFKVVLQHFVYGGTGEQKGRYNLTDFDSTEGTKVAGSSVGSKSRVRDLSYLVFYEPKAPSDGEIWTAPKELPQKLANLSKQKTEVKSRQEFGYDPVRKEYGTEDRWKGTTYYDMDEFETGVLDDSRLNPVNMSNVSEETKTQLQKDIEALEQEEQEERGMEVV